jgi:hypothetical protein
LEWSAAIGGTTTWRGVLIHGGSLSFRLDEDRYDVLVREEALLLKDPITRSLLPSTLLKAPHHGSNASSSADFLAAVKLKIIVVSAGEKDIDTNKGYNHPREETIKLFLEFTKENGNADLRTVDGYRWMDSSDCSLPESRGRKIVGRLVHGGSVVVYVDQDCEPDSRTRCTAGTRCIPGRRAEIAPDISGLPAAAVSA